MRRVYILLGLGLFACSSGSPDATPSPALVASTRAAEPLPDTPLLRLIKRSVATCKVEGGYFHECEDGYRFFDDIGALEFEDLHASLALECRLLGDADPELARLALDRLGRTTQALKRGGQIGEVADDALLACLREHMAAPGVLDPHALVAEYTQFSVGLGRDKEIVAYLAVLVDPELRRTGYCNLWKFAGMRLWPLLQGIIADSDERTAAAVLSGLDGDGLTEEDEKTLCTAFAGWLHDPRALVQEVAASHIGDRCARYHPELLAEVRAGLARGGLEDDLLLPVSYLAENCVEVGSETCEEAAALLESIALAPIARPDAREFALYAVGRYDRQKGRALAERLRRDTMPEVARAAEYLLSQ